MSYYLVNNPFPECMRFLPKQHSYYPQCISSLRTHPKFAEEYQGQTFFYSPCNDLTFSSQIELDVVIDDYRNPVCAAIQFAYLFGVKKLALFCCDDSFDKKKPASVQLDNKLWCYPQQIISQHLIDAHLYWLKTKDIQIMNCSKGPKSTQVDYIDAEEMPKFFKDDDE
jgi:hypothetical protein